MLTLSFCSPTSPAYSPTSPKFSCVQFVRSPCIDCIANDLFRLSPLPAYSPTSPAYSCVSPSPVGIGTLILTFLFSLQSDFAAVLADESGVLANESGILSNESTHRGQQRKRYSGRNWHSERTERSLLVERFVESMRRSPSEAGRVSVCLYDHDCRNAKNKIDVWVWPRDRARLVARKPLREACEVLSSASFSPHLRPCLHFPWLAERALRVAKEL